MQTTRGIYRLLRSRIWHIIGVLALLGFLDAGYLTYIHYRGGVPPCTLHGCEIVLRSTYNQLFDIPLAVLGSVYYATILLVSIVALRYVSIRMYIVSMLRMMTSIGLGMSMWFVYIQLFILHQICQYCMLSASTSTLLFVCVWGIGPKTSQKNDGKQDTSVV